MKSLYKALASAAMVLLAASCVNEVANDTTDGLFRKYNLSFEGQTKTEISGTGSSRSVNWTDGDEIKYYTKDNQSSASTASVTANGSSAFVEIPRGRNDDFINAVYGAGSLTASSSTSDCMYVDSPARNNQSYTDFAQAHLCAAFSSDLEDPNLRFHNAVSILKLTSAASISKVVFSGNNGEVITAGSSGSLKISYAGGAIAAEPSSSGGTSVNVTTGGLESDFYIAILPVNFSEGIIVSCYDASGYLLCERKTSGALNTVNAAGLPIIANLGSIQNWLDNPKPTAVDLGLSVKWASFNLGASAPEGSGDYFSWGETAPKSTYSWSTYAYGQSKNGPFSKYVVNATYGTPDYKTVLDLEDDAAHAIWGDDWRMPSKEEIQELRNNCTWTWTTMNGVNGYKVTGKKSGYTGNFIFLPAAGMMSGSKVQNAGTEGDYWSSSLYTTEACSSWSPYFTSSEFSTGDCYRYFGLPVRPVYGEVVPIAEITLSSTSMELLIENTSQLTATVLPDNATYKGLTWSTSDESVATVDATGKVSAVSLGKATITAYSADGAKTATCHVTVYHLAQSLTLDSTELEMYVGDAPITLHATVLPDEYTMKNLTWTSSRKSVATVDEEGKVTAVANGTATITAMANDGSGAKATCSVTVYTHVESVSLSKTELSLYNGKTSSLSATILPSAASDKSVTWTSSDESVATVQGSGLYAIVTGISKGNATITVTTTDGEKTATCNVEVKQYVQSITLDKTTLEFYIGDEPAILTASILPENANDKSVTWTSSNPSVATVDDNGTVTPVSAGSTMITVRAKDGSNVSATCMVTVMNHSILEISRNSITFEAAGGSKEVTVTCDNDNWSWSQAPDWVSLTRNGNKVTVEVGEYTGEEKREGEVVFVNGSLTATLKITQMGTVQHYLSLSVASLGFSSAGDEAKEVSINCNNHQWYYDTDSLPEWLFVMPDKENDKLLISCAPNVGEARSFVLEVHHSNGEITRKLSISQSAASTGGSKTYTKVTNTSELTSGEYIIVYTPESGDSYAMNGGLSTLDAASNGVKVTISGSSISYSGDDVYFTYDATEGSLKGAGGKYLAHTGTSNRINSVSSYAEASCKLTITFDGGNAIIAAPSGYVVKYNADSSQNRFRFYNSTSTPPNLFPVQLYKKE